jgi:transposase
MVLAFSRQMFVEFTVSQTMEHFLACHEHAFTAFGGVPAKIMVDFVPGNKIDLMCPAPLCNRGR